MPAEPISASPATRLAPPICDVDFGLSIFRWGWVLLAIPMGLIGVMLVALLAIRIKDYLPSHPFLVGLIMAALCAPLLWIAAVLAGNMMHRRVAEVLEAHDRCETAEESDAPLKRIKSHAAVEYLCRLLASQGRVGFVLRALSESERVEIEPLTVPFQPVPLNQRDAAFKELAADRGAVGPTGGDRRNQRGSRRPIIIYYGAILVIALLSVNEFLGFMRTGKPTFTLGYFLIMLVWLIRGLVTSPSWQSSCQWALVPGGLLRRLPDRKATWQLHLFEASTSVLIVTSYISGVFYVCVADTARSGSLQVRRQELDLLLAAWLSPLPPPKVEELGDLR